MKETIAHSIARMAPAARPGGARVLLYHDIGDPDPVDRMSLRVSRQRFLDQMTMLRDESYEVVALGSIFDAHGSGDRVRVAITFDDGYQNQMWAAEVLRTFGFPATFFIVPRFLDGMRVEERYWERWGHMRWEQAVNLAEEGFELGAHSATHQDLTSCPDVALDDEIAGARIKLERGLGRPVATFSYPFGRHNRNVRLAVQRAGYRLACSSRYGVNRSPGSQFAVYRTEVSGTDDLGIVRRKLRGKYDWLGHWQDMESWRYPDAPSS